MYCLSLKRTQTWLQLRTRLKLLDILRNSQRCTKLQLELAVVIDCGEPFVKSTYLLEGDGAL